MPCRISSARALCDIDPKRLHAVSEQLSIPSATVSFGELLALPYLDIIDMCTPPALHLAQSLAAGKQVICENHRSVRSPMPTG